VPIIAAGWRRADRGTENSQVHIRAAGADELVALQEIERAADRLFRDIGMPELADDEPLPLTEFAHFWRTGRAWVAADPTNRPVAYLLADLVDGNVHIAQVSVHPDSGHRRVGRSLIDHLAAWSAADGVPALTLTTFANVPWNAPYYARCGFRRLTEEELTPGLRAIRLREAAQGLDRWPRVCMRRDLSAPLPRDRAALIAT
jgi:GNAT superfamily N-acetyltransferase